ncbi:hypothetical protein [Devosia sp. CN2-171]|uniref:hypothetical protein n=1 Tax=Devosia sp. CN2-171 TaxID=3400909 RepID=UPI003BF7E8A4
MPESNTTIVEETQAAARGLLALLTGDRSAAGYFKFTQAGLVTSFIAVLVVTAAELVATALLGAGHIFSSLMQTALVYAAVLGTSALYLRQIGRWDALVPFIVAVNWANAILSAVMLVTVLMGLTFLGFLFLIVGVVVSINIARLVMTLKPMQIVLLIIAQAVGLIAAVLLLVMLFPPTPEQLAEIAAAANR